MNYVSTHLLLKTSCIAKAILRLLLLILTFELIYIENSLAETGDQLIISGNLVNIRTAPSIDSETATKLPRGEKHIEVQRKG